MTIETISPKFQVVNPKHVRLRMKLKPGQKLQILEVGDRIEFVPLKNIKEARGFLKGMNSKIEREKTGYEFSRFIGMVRIFYRWEKCQIFCTGN